ncbi:hypothetical protein [Lysinibacillus sp. NPDC093688]
MMAIQHTKYPVLGLQFHPDQLVQKRKINDLIDVKHPYLYLDKGV